MSERIGKYTLKISNNVTIRSSVGVAGKKESEGPLGKDFDITFKDDTLGQPTWKNRKVPCKKRLYVSF